MTTQPEDKTNTVQGKNWVEEIEVAGDKLVQQVRKLAADASVRRIRVKSRSGDLTVDVPFSVGAIAGGAVVIAAPVLAVLGALAAFVAKLDIEVVRDEGARDASQIDDE